MTTNFDKATFLEDVSVVGNLNFGKDELWSIKGNSDIPPSLEILYEDEIVAKIISDKDNISPNFTGRYSCFMIENNSVENIIGLLVSFTGEYYNTDLSQDPHISRKSTPTIKFTDKEEDVCVLGVISGIENYDRVAGNGAFKSILTQNDGINRMLVDSLGLGVVWVLDYHTDHLKKGDYITSSGIRGFGKRQKDDIKHSYTVCKLTQDCDFKSKKYILKKPVDFDTEPIYENLTNTFGENITSYNFLVKYVNIRGEFITRKQYEDELEKFIENNVKNLSLSYEEKRVIAMKADKRRVYRACLLGCVYG